MKLLVYLRDGRTCYLIAKRGILRELVGDEPWHEKGSARVLRGTWNPTAGEYVWTVAYLRWIAKGTISVVEEARDGGDAIEQSMS